MKKAIPTIIVTLIFLAVIGAYAWGVLHIMSAELSVEAMLMPSIILFVFSAVAVLTIIVLVRRIKAIKEEETKDYDEY